MTGQRLLHYEIVEKVGEGGMGVVYKARDTHLDRFVAIKVLPPEKVADPQRKARFVQEAKAASALNHPNIVTIYDISGDAGRDFIVMEYVAGKTLDQLIPRKGMRLGEALKVAMQIADALARAHAAGIVHRDLKPSNVMVDEHGLVRVLDFGLAKLAERGGPDDATATMGVKTDEGTIVGTASYMSPEQAEGRPVDARSDIFSFGSVLYEMVTGQRAFQGGSKMSILAAVINHEPSPPGEEVPRELRRVIAHCLRKDPARRFQHMDDVRGLLEELKEESDSGKLASPSRAPSRKRARWRLALAAAFPPLAVAAWFLWHSLRAPTPAPRVVSLTTYPGVENEPALSPDGRQVAFKWNGEKQDNEDIYVQLVGSGAPLRLTSDPASDRSPVWSPDGAQIAFVRDLGEQAAVYLTPALGGQERKVVDFRPVPRFITRLTPAISWSPDGRWLAIPELEPSGTNGISLVSIQSGEKRKLISSPVTASRFYQSVFSPKGDFFAYAFCTGNRSCDLNVLELGGDNVAKGQPRRLTRQGVVIEGIAWAPDGRSLIYSASRGLGGAFYLWRVFVSGGGEPARLELTGADVSNPAVSRTGNMLAYSRTEVSEDIWKFEAGAAPRRFLSSTRSEYDAHFSPDGKRVTFSTDRSGKGSELWVASSDGTNLVPLTEGTEYRLGSPRWSPDSRWIAYDKQGEDGRWDIYVIDADGGQPRRLTPHPSDENVPNWSRDGMWVYFASNRSGRYEVWRIPVAGGESVQVTHDGGFEAVESWDRKTLYYTREHSSPLFARALAGGEEQRVLESVSLLSFAVAENGIYHVVRPGGSGSFGFEIRFLAFATGKDQVLHKVELQSGQGLAVSPDGKTILYTAGTAANQDLMLVENFR